MARLIPPILSTCLIGGGIAVALSIGRPLISNKDLNPPLNPLGINGSPYGEVFAMAMQGPIDTYFDMGLYGQGHHHSPGEVCNHADHQDHANHDCKSHSDTPKATSSQSLNKRFENFLTLLTVAQETRTNPNAANEALRLHLRRKTEDKLRFANQLDPANYGNYVGLHFFLIEPALGTRPQLTPAIAKLADDTVEYCMKDMNDPRPALTAAAAASHMLHMMFADQGTPNPHFNVQQMRHYMTVLDTCINRYHTVAQQWEDSKNWNLLSSAKIQECIERLYYIGKIRDAAEATVVRLENNSNSSASN